MTNSEQKINSRIFEPRASSVKLNLKSKTSNLQTGFILPMVVIFGAIFLLLGLGLTGYLLELQKAEHNRINDEQAFNIAEAGLDYYAWHLAHFPNDLQDGTGAPGPYVHQYQDPEGGTIGSYSLAVSGSIPCGNSLTSVDITSTGSTVADPSRSVSVFGRYARPNVADYSYILNSSDWEGGGVIFGRFHSNGGVRMDSDNQSTVESSVSTWNCGLNFGCNPPQTEPGVFTTSSGSNATLFNYPVPQIDFAGISVDLGSVKSAAQAQGLYFPKLGNAQNQRGYHLIFNGDGTVTVKTVNSTTQVWSAANGSTWQKENTLIHTENVLGTYTIPASCPVIFLEDRAWIEGTVNQKVTVAAADLTGDGYNPDILLVNNINYATTDGTSGLTAIAADNVLVPLNSPNDMAVHGIFVAQNGSFERNYYCYGSGCQHPVPSAYSTDVLRNSFTFVGSLVSNGMYTVNWVSGNPIQVVSGYQTTSGSYDGTLAADPPPFTPFTSSDYHFVLWRE